MNSLELGVYVIRYPTQITLSQINEFYKEVEEVENLARKDWLLTQIQKTKIGRTNQSFHSSKKIIRGVPNLHQ